MDTYSQTLYLFGILRDKKHKVVDNREVERQRFLKSHKKKVDCSIFSIHSDCPRFLVSTEENNHQDIMLPCLMAMLVFLNR